MAKKIIQKELHENNFSVKIQDNDYDKEVNQFKKHMKAKFVMHPYMVAMLIIVLILFVCAAFLAYQSLTATVEVISRNVSDEVKDDIFIPVDESGTRENRPEAEINTKVTPQETNVTNLKDCMEIKFKVICDSEKIGNTCNLISDNNVSSQWVAASSCTSGKNPCSVNNLVIINASNDFRYVKIYNRIEKDYYINRILLNYNLIDNHFETIGYDYSLKPYTFKLLEPTKNLKINIVEIMGIGRYFQTGISEIKLYNELCE